MQGTWALSLFCPDMAVRRINRKLRRTVEEPMVGALTADGKTVKFPRVLIPETDVHCINWPLRWRVDQCVGEGPSEDGTLWLKSYLPFEQVTLYPLKGYSIAEEMHSIVEIYKRVNDTTLGALVARGEVVYPECKCDLFTGVAEQVTATGSVLFLPQAAKLKQSSRRRAG